MYKRIDLSQALKEGYEVLNKNYQLVLINLAYTVLSFIGLGLFVVIPSVLLASLRGIDLSSINATNPAALVEKMPVVGFIFIFLFLTYIVITITGAFFVFSGAVGVLSRSLREGISFRFSYFFPEAKRLFGAVLFYSLVVGFVLIGFIILIGFAALVYIALMSLFKGISPTLSVILIVIGGLVGFGIFFISLFGFLALTTYGYIIIALTNSRGFQVLKETFTFLRNNPQAFWVYVLLVVGIFVVTMLFSFVGIIIRQIGPGQILYLPYQVFLYALQVYLGYLLLTVSGVFVLKLHSKPVQTIS